MRSKKNNASKKTTRVFLMHTLKIPAAATTMLAGTPVLAQEVDGGIGPGPQRDPASGTDMGFDGRRHRCETATATATKRLP